VPECRFDPTYRLNDVRMAEHEEYNQLGLWRVYGRPTVFLIFLILPLPLGTT
jgi:hypothetical protein